MARKTCSQGGSSLFHKHYIFFFFQGREAYVDYMEIRDQSYYKEICGKSAALSVSLHSDFKELIRAARQESIKVCIYWNTAASLTTLWNLFLLYEFLWGLRLWRKEFPFESMDVLMVPRVAGQHIFWRISFMLFWRCIPYQLHVIYFVAKCGNMEDMVSRFAGLMVP